MLFLTLGPSSLPVVVAQPDESHANRAAYKWTNTEHCTISSSNEEEDKNIKMKGYENS